MTHSTVKDCNKEAGPSFSGKLYMWRHIKTIIYKLWKLINKQLSVVYESRTS